MHLDLSEVVLRHRAHPAPAPAPTLHPVSVVLPPSSSPSLSLTDTRAPLPGHTVRHSPCHATHSQCHRPRSPLGLIKPRARSPVRGAAPPTPRKRLTGSTRTRPSRPSRKAASSSCSPGTRRERWRTRPPRIGIASTSLDRGPPPERAGRRPRSTRPPPRPRYTACPRGKSNDERRSLCVCFARVTSSPYMPYPYMPYPGSIADM